MGKKRKLDEAAGRSSGARRRDINIGAGKCRPVPLGADDGIARISGYSCGTEVGGGALCCAGSYVDVGTIDIRGLTYSGGVTLSAGILSRDGNTAIANTYDPAQLDEAQVQNLKRRLRRILKV